MKPGEAAGMRAVLERDLRAKGLLLEAGFHSLRVMAIAPDAPVEFVDELRNAFFAGAKHLFSLIVQERPGDQPTDDDLRRFLLINRELEHFIKAFEAKLATKGRA